MNICKKIDGVIHLLQTAYVNATINTVVFPKQCKLHAEISSLVIHAYKQKYWIAVWLEYRHKCERKRMNVNRTKQRYQVVGHVNRTKSIKT